MKRTIKTQFGEFKCEFVGYRGTKTLRHYWVYSNKADSKTPYVQVYGKTRKQAIAHFENECAAGNFDY